MTVFAGFWVDGAVRKPEEKHFDCNGWVIANWKDRQPDLDTCRRNFDLWDEVFWLDTTPRESLTPEELFSVLKVLWPKCEAVFKPDDGASVEWQVNNHSTENQAAIDWGDLTQYPPPVETQWIQVTRENVGQHLFWECRFRDSDSKDWWTGRVSGWDEQDECCLVNSDFEEEMRIMSWSIVEVQA